MKSSKKTSFRNSGFRASRRQIRSKGYSLIECYVQPLNSYKSFVTIYDDHVEICKIIVPIGLLSNRQVMAQVISQVIGREVRSEIS